MSGARAFRSDAVNHSTPAVPPDSAASLQEPSMDEILASIRKIISDQNKEADLAAQKAADEVANPEPPVAQVDSLIGSVAADYWSTPVELPHTPSAPSQDTGSGGTKETAPEAKLEDLLEDDTPEVPTQITPVAPVRLPDWENEEPQSGQNTNASALDRLIARRNVLQVSPNPLNSEENIGASLTALVNGTMSEPDANVGLSQDSEHDVEHRIDVAIQEAMRKSDLKFEMNEEASPQPVEEAKELAVAEKNNVPPLLSASANMAIASSFERLVLSMFEERKEEMDMMMSEIMRPLLRNWLEDNLPSVVERLVRQEIERVSRGVHQ